MPSSQPEADVASRGVLRRQVGELRRVFDELGPLERVGAVIGVVSFVVMVVLAIALSL